MDDWLNKAVNVLSEKIEKKYARYGVEIRIISWKLNMGTIILETKLKGSTRESQIFDRASDVQLRLKLSMFQPFKDNQTVFIAVSNKEIEYDHLHELLSTSEYITAKKGMDLPHIVGHNVMGEVVIADLTDYPHLLLGGSTNSGKTVGLKSLILSIVSSKLPSEINLILIDVGAIDLMPFNGIPHLSCPVIRDGETALWALFALKTEMERRIDMQVSNNQFAMLPRIVLVIDEFPALIAGLGKKSKLARAITSADGEARFERLVPGRYFIEEVTAPKGYVRNTELMQIDISASKNLTVEWENQQILGNIEITKLSSADHPETGTPKGSRLAGAVFIILDENMERVDKITTDRNGWAKSKRLVPGRYAIREIRSPAGYILNSEVFYAEIKKHGDVVRFEFLNVPEDINITVTKRGNEEAVAGDVIRYDFTDVKNDSNIPLHDFYFRDNLPPEVILQSVNIPAWSHRLTYRVTYTTNLKQNPQVWQTGLHTANSYELNAADLKLAASEFITSFKLEFGTVPAGFTQDGDFYMYTKVRGDLPHEHRFVNKVDVGGRSQSDGDWHYARDSWATVVFSKPKGPLPRTGLIVCPESQAFSDFSTPAAFPRVSALFRAYSAASSSVVFRTLIPPQSGQRSGSLLLSKQKRHLQI